MAQVTLKINDRSYDMTCDDGQEDHLRKLAAHVDDRMRQLAGSVGQVGEARLLIMASLLIADELFDAFRQIQDLDTAGKGGNAAVQDHEVGNGAAAALQICAERIEAMAARLAGGRSSISSL